MSSGNFPLEVDVSTVHQLQTTGEAFLFLDCRESGEYDTAHIEGTLLIPMSELQERASELESHRNSRIVVHCHHGGRSLRVANWLRGQGYQSAQSMAGGIDQWSEQVDSSIPRY